MVTMPPSSEELEAGAGGIQVEIAQRKPFHSVKAEIAVSILRTAALIERHFAQVVARTGLTIQQYNVLRILRGAGREGMPTLVIRDRMIHAAPGITRLLDKLEKAGFARREARRCRRRRGSCCRQPPRRSEIPPTGRIDSRDSRGSWRRSGHAADRGTRAPTPPGSDRRPATYADSSPPAQPERRCPPPRP